MEKERSDVEEDYEALAVLTADNVKQRPRLARLRRLLDEREHVMGPQFDTDTLFAAWKIGSMREVREVLMQMQMKNGRFWPSAISRPVSAKYMLLTICVAGSLALVLVGASAFLILRDLNARRRAEEELRRARHAAESAKPGQERISREYEPRTPHPLTVMMGYTDLLSSRLPAPKMTSAATATSDPP